MTTATVTLLEKLPKQPATNHESIMSSLCRKNDLIIITIS